MAFATVTPSFVIFGEPNCCSITTFRPWQTERTSKLAGTARNHANHSCRRPWRRCSVYLRTQSNLHCVCEFFHSRKNSSSAVYTEANVLGRASELLQGVRLHEERHASATKRNSKSITWALIDSRRARQHARSHDRYTGQLVVAVRNHKAIV